MDNASAAEVKILLVGDSFVGKTSLLRAILKLPFVELYDPTACENSVISVCIRGRQIKFDLWDTAGNEIHDRFGQIIYSGVDTVLACFSIDMQCSITSLADYWIPRVRHYCRHNARIILVGCKSDLRFQTEWKQDSALYCYCENQRCSPPQSLKLLSVEEGYAMATRTGAYKYLETSAKLKLGIDTTITLTAEFRRNQKKCTICAIA